VLLNSIDLHNFRCHRRLHASFCKTITWITGPNGAGKTSLIEAIHFLARLKSHITASTKSLFHFGTSEFAIQGQLAEGNKILLKKNTTARELFLNQNKTELQEFYGLLPVVIFSNHDIHIIRNGGSDRRSHLNSILALARRSLIPEMIRYNRILVQRSAEIKKNHPDKRTLDALTSQLITVGKPLQEARMEIATIVAAYAAFFHKRISNSHEKLKIKIYPAPWQCNTAEEIQQQRNLIGWQRDAVEIYINGKAAQKFASEGQQRTAALALRAAEYTILRRHLDLNPLVLVDDVLGELDTARRRTLIELLDPTSQTIIAATEVDKTIRDALKQPHAEIRLAGESRPEEQN
jgi:DNA replication and repair protein RecF